MSVHVVNNRAGDAAHEVRWRTLDGRQRSERFESADEADEFDAAVRARAALERAQLAWDAVPERWRTFVRRRRTELL